MRARKKAVILGAGISGLTAAYDLSKNHDVIVLEKKERVGGWIETDDQSPFFFEKGPRTFPTRRANSLLQLALELGLESELIPTSSHAKKRYILHRGALCPVPASPLSLISSPLTKGLLSRLLFKEWRIPPQEEDETVWEFARRRLGRKASDLLFDPLIKGIFGGDSKRLSVEASLPFLKELERNHGSLLKGMFKSKKKRVTPPSSLENSSLFAFRSGVRCLIRALCNQIEGEIVVGEGALEITKREDVWEVVTHKRRLSADLLISALPAFEGASLFESIDSELAQQLSSIPYKGLTLVHCGFESEVLAREGFGYLIPSCEKEEALGVFFDSSIFPQQNRLPKETRLTVILPESVDFPEERALHVLLSHLKIKEGPSFIKVSKAQQAIPQYHLGHLEIISKIESRLKQKHPTALMVGSAFKGVSVNECICQARDSVAALGK